MSRPVYKYLSQAAVGGALLGATVGYDATMRIGGMQVPSYAIGAGLGVAGSFLADMAHDYVLPHISKDDRLRHVEGALFAPAVSAATFYAGLTLLHPSAVAEAGRTMVLVQGAGSELAAQWLYENILSPYVTEDFKESSSF